MARTTLDLRSPMDARTDHGESIPFVLTESDQKIVEIAREHLAKVRYERDFADRERMLAYCCAAASSHT